MPAHIVTPRTYFFTFVALLALTATTVGLTYINLGRWHTFIGLAIALVKALLVILVFMHLMHSRRMTWIVALSGLFWLGIMLSLTLSDVLTRGWPT